MATNSRQMMGGGGGGVNPTLPPLPTLAILATTNLNNGFHQTLLIRGSRDVSVVRVLASHQCAPGSIPGPGVMWVEFVVGSRPCSKKFFSGYSGFPSPQKPTFRNSNSIWKVSPISALRIDT